MPEPEKNKAAQELRSLRRTYNPQVSRDNGKLGGRPITNHCECSATDANTNYHDHEKSCPAYKRLQRQEYRRRKKEKEQKNAK